MTDLDARRLQRRYLLLRATRWFPTGLIIPVFVLYLVDKGLTYGQIGLVTAAQGVMVLLLELPTGVCETWSEPEKPSAPSPTRSAPTARTYQESTACRSEPRSP